jgi:hypothetical protein
MRKCFYLSLLLSVVCSTASGQSVLPGITVKNISGRIVISWRNDYKEPVVNLSIQRSYDSLKNYTTIGSVLNPQNVENGYADESAPYNKMYYRIFISFAGGSYLFSEVRRPVKDSYPAPTISPADKPNSSVTVVPQDPMIWINRDSSILKIPPIINKPDTVATSAIPVIKYPSSRIYTGKDNNIIIELYNAKNRKYLVKFYDEYEHPLFELNKITEDYLIIEKVNFMHAGWFIFEVYENGKSIERNRFFIARDGK